MRREFNFEKFTSRNYGCVYELDWALETIAKDNIVPYSIRMHFETAMEFETVMLNSMSGVNSYMFACSPASYGGGFMVAGYRDRFTGVILDIIKDPTYPIKWFALESEFVDWIPNHTYYIGEKIQTSLVDWKVDMAGVSGKEMPEFFPDVPIIFDGTVGWRRLGAQLDSPGMVNAESMPKVVTLSAKRKMIL